jgi:hypothetical protein
MKLSAPDQHRRYRVGIELVDCAERTRPVNVGCLRGAAGEDIVESRDDSEADHLMIGAAITQQVQRIR